MRELKLYDGSDCRAGNRSRKRSRFRRMSAMWFCFGFVDTFNERDNALGGVSWEDEDDTARSLSARL